MLFTYPNWMDRTQRNWFNNYTEMDRAYNMPNWMDRTQKWIQSLHRATTSRAQTMKATTHQPCQTVKHPCAPKKKTPCALLKSQIGARLLSTWSKGSWIFKSNRLRWRCSEGRGNLHEPVVVDVGVEGDGLHGGTASPERRRSRRRARSSWRPASPHDSPPPPASRRRAGGRRPPREKHEDRSEWGGDGKAPVLWPQSP
jgi:hypothetical protein